MIYPTLAMNILCLGENSGIGNGTFETQSPQPLPGVPETLAFDLFWPLKVSEGQGAKFAEFLLWAFEVQELNLNLKKIGKKSKFQ